MQTKLTEHAAPMRGRPESTAPGGDVIRIGGAFDLAAARNVVARVEELSGGAVVRLDLSRAREIHDVALAMLAMARVPVIIAGLSRHHERLLRYIAAFEHQRKEEEEHGDQGRAVPLLE